MVDIGHDIDGLAGAERTAKNTSRCFVLPASWSDPTTLSINIWGLHTPSRVLRKTQTSD